VTPQR